MRDIYVVITAAGSGTRMGASVPKQFMNLAGKPVLRHTIECFTSLSRKVNFILVLPADQKRLWLDYCIAEDYRLGPHVVTSGGFTRFHSVKNALKYVPDGAVAAIHDGVRPFADKMMLEELFRLSEDEPAVAPAIASVDTLRMMEPAGEGILRETAPVDRSLVYGVQTPQVFHSELLRQAYSQPFSERFTDDASVVESFGHKVKYIRGSRFNIKLTTPDDIVLAEALHRVLDRK